MKLGKGRVSCWKRGLPALGTKLISILQAKCAQAYFIAIVICVFSLFRGVSMARTSKCRASKIAAGRFYFGQNHTVIDDAVTAMAGTAAACGIERVTSAGEASQIKL